MPLTFRPQHHKLRQVCISLLPADVHFLGYAASYLGVSMNEFVRRLLHAARERWLRAGVYRPPLDTAALAAEVSAQTRARRRGRHKVKTPLPPTR